MIFVFTSWQENRINGVVHALTCTGTKAGVISQQPLLLENTFQVDSKRSLIFLFLLYFLPSVSSSSSAGLSASICSLFSIYWALQSFEDLLLLLLIGQICRSCWPINSERSKEGDDVAVFGKLGAIKHWKSKAESATSIRHLTIHLLTCQFWAFLSSSPPFAKTETTQQTYPWLLNSAPIWSASRTVLNWPRVSVSGVGV